MTTQTALRANLPPPAPDDAQPGAKARENGFDHESRLWTPAEMPKERNYRNGKPDPRSTDPERQAAFLQSMIKSFARRTRDLDPETGLAPLLRLQAVLREEIKLSGRAAVASYTEEHIAGVLGVTQQAVSKRWGAGRD